MATPHGRVLDWKKGECEPIPGTTMPRLVVVERDYGAVFDQMGALGPLMEELGTLTKESARRHAGGGLPAPPERRDPWRQG
jgi:nitrate reductase alpha subunit